MKEAHTCNIDYHTMTITNEQLEKHQLSNKCWICDNSYGEMYEGYKYELVDKKYIMVCDKYGNPVKEMKQSFKVKRHNHFTGNYHSSICSKCNIQIKDTNKIPVFFYNRNYDKKYFQVISKL